MKTKLNVKANGNAELTLKVNGKTVKIEGAPLSAEDMAKFRALRNMIRGN